MAKKEEELNMFAAPNSEKLKALQAAMDKIEKNFGKGSIMKLGDEHVEQVEVIPTGSIALDAALGVGGYPKGRIIEIYGPESSGKTTLAIHAIGGCYRVPAVALIGKGEGEAALKRLSTTIRKNREIVVGVGLETIGRCRQDDSVIAPNDSYISDAPPIIHGYIHRPGNRILRIAVNQGHAADIGNFLARHPELYQ